MPREPRKAVVCLSMEMRTRRASALTEDTGNYRPLLWLRTFLCTPAHCCPKYHILKDKDNLTQAQVWGFKCVFSNYSVLR